MTNKERINTLEETLGDMQTEMYMLSQQLEQLEKQFIKHLIKQKKKKAKK